MKTLFLLNHAPLYRKSIYRLIQSNIRCEFAFGKINKGNIESLSQSDLIKPFYQLKTYDLIFGLYYIQNSLSLSLSNNYRNIVLTGEFKSITCWIILFQNFFFGNKKIFLWTHGYYGSENMLKRIIKRIFFYLCDGIFLYGNHAKNLMIKDSIIDKNKIYLIYNSLDFDLQNNYFKKLSTRKQENPFLKIFKNRFPNLIFVGRLTKIKKLDLIIKAQFICQKENRPFNLLLLGMGDEFVRLNTIVKKLKLDKYVSFFGETYDEKIISKYLYFADICVSPGNVGLTAIHSLTYNTPVITHDFFERQMPEFETIQDKKNGYFFKYNNENDLSSKILECLDDLKSKKNKNFRKIILDYYNPHYQIKVFKKHLENDG